MKIGVDAGALGISDERLKVGVYRVIYNMLRVLGTIDTKNQYLLYSFDPIDRNLMQEFGPNMENKVLWPVKGWFRLRVPLELKFHPVDVFLGTSQALPRTHAKTIGFVYDLGFLHHPASYPGSYIHLVHQTKKLIQRADHIITISQSVADDIQKTYKRMSDIHVAYPGSCDCFTSKGDRFTDTNPYFLFVGALKPGKNIPTLIRAFAAFLKTQKKPYDLFLVGGDFWKDKAIDSEIATHHLQHRVRQIGFVSDSELADYYRGAVALVSPSLHEGFCLPIVEAMASGCPVIGSTAPAIPEIVGKAGILTDPGNINELSRAMASMTSVNLRKKYIRSGIVRAKRFTWEHFGKSVLHRIYEAV